MSPEVVLLTKQDRFSRAAQVIVQEAFGNAISIYEGSVGDPEPLALEYMSPSYLISFLSPWIVRKDTLDRSGTAINFHPGPVEYPGIGCYNFALYENAREFGCVCHHMLTRVDTGKIIMQRRFPLAVTDTVETLKLRTMTVMLAMFEHVLGLIMRGESLPIAEVEWARPPIRRSDMEALKVITCSMSSEEIARRLRATIYPGYPGPVLHCTDGSSIMYPVPNRTALA